MYEDTICELRDGDPRIAEFYGFYEVGEDGLCEAERLAL
jgi:hypothetical protein